MVTPKHILGTFDEALASLRNNVLMMSSLTERSLERAMKAFIARSKLRSVRLDIIRTLLRSDASASSNVPRICLGAIIDCRCFYFTLSRASVQFFISQIGR